MDLFTRLKTGHAHEILMLIISEQIPIYTSHCLYVYHTETVCYPDFVIVKINNNGDWVPVKTQQTLKRGIEEGMLSSFGPVLLLPVIICNYAKKYITTKMRCNELLKLQTHGPTLESTHQFHTYNSLSSACVPEYQLRADSVYCIRSNQCIWAMPGGPVRFKQKNCVKNEILKI